MTYICIVANYWGKGATPEAAKAACRKAGGTVNKRVRLRVYRCVDDEAYVNEMGGVVFKKGTAADVFEEQLGPRA